MKLPLRQLKRHLEGPLAPAYLVAGDEPLLVGQATARIRKAARGQGFDERDLHVVDAAFRWSELEAATGNLSLFGSRTILELRLASPRPGDAGARAIRALAEADDPDRLLVVSIAAKLDAQAARSAWVKAVERRGVVVDVWPVERGELPRWIRERAAALELELTRGAAELLADRVEGNLVAADQELRKLAITGARRTIDEAAVLDAVADSARFDVFRLTDAVLSGDAARAFTVLAGLRREGVQPALVTWALSREIGLLARLAFALQQGERPDAAMQRLGVWRRRQPAVRAALGRFGWRDLERLLARGAAVDAVVKGVEPGRPWDALTGWLLAVFEPPARAAGRGAARG